MFTKFEVENYRGFEHFSLDGLKQVNLLVGNNNCGKTSLLEAVELLAAHGHPDVFNRVSWQRDEAIDVGKGRPAAADISHFFLGHQFELGAKFVLRGVHEHDRKEELVARIVANSQQSLFADFDFEQGTFALELNSNGSDLSVHIPSVPIHMSGALDFSSARLPPLSTLMAGNPIQFVSLNSVERTDMASMWDQVLEEGREDDVVSAMKILDSELDNIVFRSSPTGSRRRSAGRGVLLGFRGKQRRVPLGSHGEGMRRLLAISLSLICTANGYLLMDEIDTGLHWSIMGDLWRLVIETAKKENAQVFATSHSGDCVKGLAWACENYPELTDHVSIQKVDPALKQSITLPGERIPFLVEQAIEVR